MASNQETLPLIGALNPVPNSNLKAPPKPQDAKPGGIESICPMHPKPGRHWPTRLGRIKP